MRRIAFSLVEGAALAGVVTYVVPRLDKPTTRVRTMPLRETVTVAADVPIPNLPGKRLVSHVVDYPPGASSAPHRHARSAFIYACVLSGEIRSQVDGEPDRVYRLGETWFESPGAHPRMSANASDTEPARLLAVIIVDEADEQLTIPDPQ
jgi:quercetin dioxygenase-like cupin family protein